MLAKKTLRKYLFRLKVPLSYNQCVGTFEAVKNDSEIPKGVDKDSVMLLKRVLQTYRTTTNKIDKSLVALESQLVERAAEMGNNDAVALLAREVLENKESSQEDKAHADKLLTQLMDQRHPVAFKMAGDLAYQASTDKSKARRFYELAVEHGVEHASEVECLRNIGLIHFQNKKIMDARTAFQKAVEAAQDESKVVDCHFYLAQIFEADRTRSKYHLEKAAAYGLKQSFAPLGFMNLNWFDKPEIAQDWFLLGREAGDGQSLVGLLDVYVKKGMLDKASETVEHIKKLSNADEILNLRQEHVQRVAEYAAARSDSLQTGDRWGF